MSFAIQPSFPGGASGTVTITATSAGVRYHVVVTGLVAGSVHTIHAHVGSCAAVRRSTHIAVLAVSTANNAGILAFDRVLPAFDSGRGHIVIVYNTAQAFLVTGCASP